MIFCIVLYCIVLYDSCILLLFIILAAAVVKFKDAAYSVVEGNEIFTVVIEKVGSNAQELTLSVRLDGETATSMSQ